MPHRFEIELQQPQIDKLHVILARYCITPNEVMQRAVICGLADLAEHGLWDVERRPGVQNDDDLPF